MKRHPRLTHTKIDRIDIADIQTDMRQSVVMHRARWIMHRRMRQAELEQLDAQPRPLQHDRSGGAVVQPQHPIDHASAGRPSGTVDFLEPEQVAVERLQTCQIRRGYGDVVNAIEHGRESSGDRHLPDQKMPGRQHGSTLR
ncbi:hypothetical protein D3C84_411640 [compost metagenome]